MHTVLVHVIYVSKYNICIKNAIFTNFTNSQFIPFPGCYNSYFYAHDEFEGVWTQRSLPVWVLF